MGNIGFICFLQILWWCTFFVPYPMKTNSCFIHNSVNWDLSWVSWQQLCARKPQFLLPHQRWSQKRVRKVEKPVQVLLQECHWFTTLFNTCAQTQTPLEFLHKRNENPFHWASSDNGDQWHASLKGLLTAFSQVCHRFSIAFILCENVLFSTNFLP